MRYQVIGIDELGPTEWDRWREIQRAEPSLSSPYFCPEFTHCVGEVCLDARVCVLEGEDGIAGFFPFQRKRFGIGTPIGGLISDYHGLVARTDLACDTKKLLERCGLLVWEFDHLPSEQRAFARHHRSFAPSPAIDVSRGFAAYLGDLRKGGSHRLQQLSRKARKLEREVGPLRFDPYTDDPKVLRAVIALKSEQCRRTGSLDFFTRLPWTRALVGRLAETKGSGFQGLVSALWAGDQLVAAHFGMCSDRVLHWWFPVYDRAFGRYSPGALLLLRVIEHASERGLILVDLGKGDDAYKATFANVEVLLAEGYATSHVLISRVRDAGLKGQGWLRTAASPLRPAWRRVRTWMRSTRTVS